MKYSRKRGVSKIRNATKVEYKGLHFKSKLEYFMYKLFEENNIPVDYEKKVFLCQEGFTTGCNVWVKDSNNLRLRSKVIRPVTYTPDFVDKAGRFIVECKGKENDAYPLRIKMFLYQLKQDGVEYDFYEPRNHQQCQHVIDLIKQKL